MPATMPLIDTHAHILPGMDDGPSSPEESIRMARIAVQDGIHSMIATPHCFNGVYSSSKDAIISACDRFNNSLKENYIDLTVLPGCEARLSVEIIEKPGKEYLMTLNNTGVYLSVELPDQFIPHTIIGFINRVRNSGIVPIITHPERNTIIQKDIQILSDLIAAGAISQVTAASITGLFGRQARKSCGNIIQQDMVHLVASDAHSPKTRPPILTTAMKKLSSILDKETLERLFYHNPEMIIRGELF